jgi:uncharacterized membrane protein
MWWFYLSLFCALSLATADMFSKKALAKSDESTITLIRFSACLPPLYVLLYLNGIPQIKEGFWSALLFAAPLEIAAMVLYNRAIKLSPLSLTLPFLSFTPIFLIGTSYLMTRESAHPYAVLGIVLITIGGYLLNIDPKKGFLYPFKAIVKEKGSALMLIVAFIYSITSVFGKMMVDRSDFIFTPAVYFTVVTLFTVIFVSIKGGAGFKGLVSNKRLHLLVGVFSTLMILSHFLALSKIKVEYMVSVKRSSMLFAILYGSYVFKEVDIKKRFSGAFIMLIGIVMIGIFSQT